MNNPSHHTDSFSTVYQQQRITHWDKVAQQGSKSLNLGNTYHRHLSRVFRFLIPKGQRILEIGCGKGDLLAALEPSEGVGVDFSAEMIRRAVQSHPNLQFIHADAHDLSMLDQQYDVIILSDIVNDLWDVQLVLEQVRRLSGPHTHLILNYYSHLWEFSLSLAQKLRLATPRLEQNWLTNEDVTNLLHLSGFDVIRGWQEFLFPLPIPLIEPFCNHFLARIWPFKELALCNFIIARPADLHKKQSAVTVVVPARNEAGNILSIFERMPKMGSRGELIFVEGHSKDDTGAVIEREIARHPEWACQFLRQTGEGKADAVRLGFQHATGDILMILDADLTVPPEDLPRFFQALVSGKGEFINGVRLVYPMEREAMRFANLLGNKVFSLLFSWLIGQPIKDTLCGTKVLWRADYEKIAANRSYFGDFDPFGDFDLIFGAAKLGLKITDLPIRYRERTYGTTNIQRWKHGWLLLKMVWFAAIRLKFF
jgi:ubiquinone/menaquinone biosynthesis C-methylase UbiE